MSAPQFVPFCYAMQTMCLVAPLGSSCACCLPVLIDSQLAELKAEPRT